MVTRMRLYVNVIRTLPVLILDSMTFSAVSKFGQVCSVSLQGEKTKTVSFHFMKLYKEKVENSNTHVSFSTTRMCTIHLILEIGYTQVLKRTKTYPLCYSTTAINFQELHPTTPDSDSAKQYKNHP